MIKIVATISDFGAAANIGGDTIKKSYIIDVPTQNIPPKLKEYFIKEDRRSYTTLSFSLLDEDE